MRVFGGDTVFREAIATGETVEQAIQNACSELGIESCGDNFEIIEMPTKKTLGIFGGNPAKVRVFVKESPAQAAADYLLNVLEQMGNEHVTVDIQEEEGGAMLCVSGGDMGYMIGHRGETLDALQYLSGLIAVSYTHLDVYKRQIIQFIHLKYHSYTLFFSAKWKKIFEKYKRWYFLYDLCTI